MKIGFAGLELPEGKVKYDDPDLNRLAEKDKPKKVTPYFAELVRDLFDDVDAVAIAEPALLDLLILDMDKIDGRLGRTADDAERDVLARAQGVLETERPVSDVEWTEADLAALRAFGLLSLKPVLRYAGAPPVNDLITAALAAAGLMFFYTSGPKETHAWLVSQGATILECAAKIHSDLARGFIKGDVVGVDDYITCHNFAECHAKGLARLVDRDYLVQPREVIEIRFNL